MKTVLIILTAVIIALASCSEDNLTDSVGQPNNNNENNNAEGPDENVNDNGWLIPFAEVRTYPHKILDWHEIVNDDTPSHSLAVIYCPLTGT